MFLVDQLKNCYFSLCDIRQTIHQTIENWKTNFHLFNSQFSCKIPNKSLKRRIEQSHHILTFVRDSRIFFSRIIRVSSSASLAIFLNSLFSIIFLTILDSFCRSFHVFPLSWPSLQKEPWWWHWFENIHCCKVYYISIYFGFCVIRFWNSTRRVFLKNANA